jgi:serine/threonine protein kinase
MSDNLSAKRICPKCSAPLAANTVEGLCPACLLALNLAAQTELTGETGPHGTKIVPATPAPADIAKFFPQLQIIACLGRGGMGVVYQARQPRLNRLVALKILAPVREHDPAFAGRFEKEAQALARLSHPNIVTIHDFGETGGMYFLLMEYVDGVTLGQLLATRRISAREALAIVPQICDALQFAHDQGIVHRDIKPENILMDRRGRVKVADFGLAKIVGGEALTPALSHRMGDGDAAGQTGVARPPDLTEASKVLGTPNYMAPEQVSHPTEVDHRADIYALGVVFYQMLTGELPGQSLAPPSSKVLIDVRLDEVVLRALAQEPARRYQQAGEVKTQVETIATSMAPPPRDAAAAVESAVTTISQCAESDPRVAEALRSLRPWNPLEVTALLAGHLNSVKDPVRRAAIYILWKGAFASIAPAIGALQTLLQHPENFTRGMAALALGANHSVDSCAAVAAMARDDRDEYARRCAGMALQSFRTPPATPVTLLGMRDKWLWDTSYVTAMAFYPSLVVTILLAALFAFLGTKALFIAFLLLPGLGFAAVYGFVGSRIRQLKAALPPCDAEVAEALIFRRPVQSPGLALLHADRLELIRIVGEPITIPFKDVASLSEVTWFNGTRLWWKRGFVLDLRNGQRVGVAVPEPFGRRWRALLSGGSLPELPPQPAAAPPNRSPESPLSFLAFTLATLSGVLGAVAWFLMPEPPQLLVWSILAAALLGVILGIRTRTCFRGKTAIIGGGANVAVWLIVFLLFNVFDVRERHYGNNAKPSLADSPQVLSALPTGELLRVALDKPQSSWPWIEMGNRARAGQLTPAEAGQISDDLAALIRLSCPQGYGQPLLGWLGNFIGDLDRSHLVSGTNATALLEAYYGNPSIEPLPRVRQGQKFLQLRGNSHSVWANSPLFGFSFLNAMSPYVTLDGQVVPAKNLYGNNWSQVQYQTDLNIQNLTTGSHTVHCEFETALVATDDLAGLDAYAPAADWPRGERRWTRACEAEFVIYPKDAVLVQLSQEPALDPVTSGALSIQRVIIRHKGASLMAVLAFNLGPKPGLPISLEVRLRLPGQEINCGSVLALQNAEGTTSSQPLSADIGALDPQIKEAELRLVPNPQGVEKYPGIDRIWGREIVLSHVPLARQDLPGAAAFGPVVERTISLGRRNDSFFSYDTESYVSPPQDFDPTSAAAGDRQKLWKWLTDHRADLFVQRANGRPVLAMSDMVTAVIDESDFDRLTPAQLAENPVWHGALAARFRPSSQTVITGAHGGKVTVAFQTRYDVTGLLQVIGVDSNPPGVKIRYKLANQ